MTRNFNQNHFALFGLPVSFDVDAGALERAYRELQREVHPDRHAQATEAEQRIAAQWSTRSNEAYRILQSPIARGRYLLHLNGIDTAEETDTAMPVAFLVSQMDWREAVESARRARDDAALDRLGREERALRAALVGELRDALGRADWPAARLCVRKLRFIEKLAEEIDLAAEALDT
ncbi:MAG: Fe-S protein assembly co-chaperone HscB [Betaproteobacteria bacterium]|nr:Fe-S protein assembly co-chaperone HscB [Betaproteobacteria bacterium]